MVGKGGRVKCEKGDGLSVMGKRGKGYWWWEKEERLSVEKGEG